MATIHNITTDTTVVATHHMDTVLNYAGGVMVSTGSGNDSIYSDVRDPYQFNNEYGYVTIDAGSGNDKILSTGRYVSINGGIGSDLIRTGNSDDVTVVGGPGNDTIGGFGENKVYQYAQGDGNDVILGYSSTDKIILEGNSDYSTVISGSNIIINLYQGKITLKDMADTAVNIEGGNLVDDPVAGSYGEYITNTVKESVITGSSYSDTVYNYGSNVNVSVGAEADNIYNVGSNTTVDAGEGNDRINNQTDKSSASLSGGAGDDSIYAGRTSFFVTLNGGTGNDTLVGSDSTKYGDIYQFANTDGNDIIMNYESNDTIQFSELEDLTSISYYKSGTDFIFDIDMENRITLKNAGNKQIQVELADGSAVTLSYNTSLPGPGYEDTYINVQDQEEISDEDLTTNSAAYALVETEDDTLNGDDSNDTPTLFSLPSGVTYNAKKSSLTIKSPFSGTFDTAGYELSSVKTIDASKNNNFVTIKGNDANNAIKAGKKGSNLYGNGGDDTLTGGKGVDNFYYADGDGNDTIVKYKAGQDIIHITGGEISSAVVKGSNVILNVGDGSIKIKSGKNKNIKIADADGEIKTYKFKSGTIAYPTKNFIERNYIDGLWFANDDNFVKNDVDSLVSEVSLNDNAISTVDNNCNVNTTLENLIQKDKSFTSVTFNKDNKY